ncbi:uncharacterized protein [Gossypium hirsutum]|uniref:Retrotransposon gag domain-containing protein n=1 Tax=Gossypium hirsutum TaxID=3635 RepID=A0A1U8KGC5_GOSHI|nr:uncharacterized protein LOC107915361 [Gossypium hirsutum]
MNFQTGLGSNPGDNPTNPIIHDLDVIEKEEMRLESSRQLEERCRWLEEKFKALENTDNRQGIDAKDLNLVPDLVLPQNFKMPEFENLVGAAARWCNQLSRARISSWRYLAQAFIQQYNHVTDMTLDRITLQNMEKKPNESFKQYAQRWKEVVMQVQTPLLEKKTTMLLINTLKAPFITHMIESTTKSFADIVMTGEMIENAIRGGKIERETAKRSAPRRKDNEVNNTSSYNSKAITVSQSRATTVGQQGFQKQGSDTRQNSKKISFTPIPVTYRELYQSLFNAYAIAPFHLKPLQPPYPKWNKEDVAEVRIPMKVIWKEMMKREMIISEEENKGARDYWKFHAEEGHEIQECDEFKALVQSLMDNKELEFSEAGSDEGHVYALEGEPKNQRINRPRIIISLPRNNEIETQITPKVIIHKPASFPYKDNKSVPWNYDCNVTILEREDIASTSKEAQVEGSYIRSGKRYDTEGVRVVPTKVKAFDIKKEKRVEVLVNEPVKEEEAREFLKFLKHSEYSVVEQLRKQPARISVLALLLSSEVHREALMKMLNETYVTNDISVNKLDRLFSNISADNFIYFNDDEIPPGGMGSAKALHITTRCKRIYIA